MNLQICRKPLGLLGFTMALVVSAYWISDSLVFLPHPATHTSAQASDTEIDHAPEAESVLMDGNWSQPLMRHSALI